MTSTAGRLRSWIEKSLAECSHQTLDDIVRQRRFEGESWQDVAFAVREMSGEKVSAQALISWFPKYNRPAKELAASQSALSPVNQRAS